MALGVGGGGRGIVGRMTAPNLNTFKILSVLEIS